MSLVFSENIQSKTIEYLRFPLILLVVMIHSNLTGIVIKGVDLTPSVDNHIFYMVSNLISNIIARIAVPLFYFISGFLFFYKVDRFKFQTYIQKLSKRFRTIFIPYLFWNLVVIILFFLAEKFVPGIFSGRNKPISTYSFMDWIYAFYDTNMINPNPSCAGYPINYPFWFIRDLIIVMLFTPVIHYVIKKLKFWSILLMGLLWFFDLWFPVVGFSIAAFFFFMFGASFSILKKNFIVIMNKNFSIYTILYIVICLILLFTDERWYSPYLQRIGIVIGLALAINIVSFLLAKGSINPNPFMSKSSFFIFAVHAMPLVLLIKYLFIFLQPHSDFCYLLIYLLSPIFIVIVSMFLYKLLSLLFPRITAVITGGRI